MISSIEVIYKLKTDDTRNLLYEQDPEYYYLDRLLKSRIASN